MTKWSINKKIEIMEFAFYEPSDIEILRQKLIEDIQLLSLTGKLTEEKTISVINSLFGVE